MRASVLMLLVACAWACDGHLSGDERDGGLANDGTVPLDANAPTDAAPGDAGDVTDAGDVIIDAGDVTDAGGTTTTGCSAAGLELIRLVNEYRAENGLAAIPASPSLCTVSQAHTRDLVDHSPHTAPGCNMHSWSDRGSWSACCYTADHAAASCMWNKPRQLTSYPGNGYENAYRGSDNPVAVLAGWKSSSGHNDVILNRGGWSREWRAIGADIQGGFAVLWFGHEVDPAGR